MGWQKGSFLRAKAEHVHFCHAGFFQLGAIGRSEVK